MTPERKAEIEAQLEAILGPKPLPKPKVVTRDDSGTVRDADVHVSRADVNASGQDQIVSVRRADYVTINMAAYEAQQLARARERAERRALDPSRLGTWGPVDDLE